MTAFFPAGAADALELLIRATLLIGAAWAAAAALRAAGASAAARHMAWLLGIAALLALPLVWSVAPALRLPILPEAAAASAAAAAPSALAAPVLAGSTAPEPPLPGGWPGLFLLVYALGAGFLLLRIAVARRVLARIWREAEGEAGPDWEALLSELSLGMDLPRPVELRIADGPAMPMTWGTLEPRILLPAEAADWPPERRRLVLLHELAHVARRDSLSRSAASLACALYWFHPGAWLAARQMRIEQEHAADDRVLVAGGSARAYARSLLHLAAPSDSWRRPAHAAAMAGMVQLERRLTSIVTPVRRDRPTAVFLAASAAAAALATLVVAAAIPVGFSSMPNGEIRPGLAGAEPDVTAPDLRAEREMLAAGIAAREAASNRTVEQPAPPQASLAAHSFAESRASRTDVGAGTEQAQPPAERTEPAATASISAPAIPALVSAVPFTLPPAAPYRSDRLAGRPQFRIAMSEPAAGSPNLQRALVDGVPPRTNRIASWGRFHLSSTTAQPALP